MGVVDSMMSFKNLVSFSFDSEEARVVENCFQYLRSRKTSKSQYPATTAQSTGGGINIKMMPGQLLSKDATHPLIAKWLDDETSDYHIVGTQCRKISQKRGVDDVGLDLGRE